jgi:hypothetical protein
MAVLTMAGLPLQAALAAGPSWDGVQDRDLSGWELRLIPYAYHFHPDPAHKDVYGVGLDKVDAHGWLAGGMAFSNSFGQPCVYVYGGRKYVEPFGWERIYWSWTAGIIYGYKEPYEHKVPLNKNGFSPGFIPAIGYQITPTISTELALLGTAGVTFNMTFVLK